MISSWDERDLSLEIRGVGSCTRQGHMPVWHQECRDMCLESAVPIRDLWCWDIGLSSLV